MGLPRVSSSKIHTNTLIPMRVILVTTEQQVVYKSTMKAQMCQSIPVYCKNKR